MYRFGPADFHSLKFSSSYTTTKHVIAIYHQLPKYKFNCTQKIARKLQFMYSSKPKNGLGQYESTCDKIS
jgi:hypothetical protein